jgi:RNA polymerase sigma-70 factor (family 1)
MSQNEMNDVLLMGMLREGDRNAFDLLYRRYFTKLYGVVYNRVRSKQVTEEIIQELFFNLWLKRADISIEHTFSSYIFTAVKYMVFKYFRNEGVQRRYSDYLKVNFAGEKNFTEDAVLYNDLNSRYEHALGQLPAKSAFIFKLSRVQHRSNKEIAEELSITEKAVEYHITKSLSILRNLLKDYYPLLLLSTLF